MEYVIGLIILSLGLITYTLIMRKRVYNEVARLESWKVEIMNRPVTEEISRVKELNLTGQAEEKFESWRNTWDDIVTRKFPDVEERLFDAEEAAEKFRFTRAKKINQETNEDLQEIEEQIKLLLSELQDLLGSEQQNRVDVEGLRQTVKQVKKRLLTERHTFGKAESYIEAMIENVEKQFAIVDQQTVDGNYFEARETVLNIKNELIDIEEKSDLVPELLADCQNYIPAQIQELRSGIAEMQGQEYVLSHLPIETELEKIEEELAEHQKFIEKAEIDKVKDEIFDIKEVIEEMYDALEKEVISKQIIDKEAPHVEPLLHQLREEIAITKEETEFVQLSYQLTEKDLETQHRLETELNHMLRKYEDTILRMKENNAPATQIRKELEKITEKVKEIMETHATFRDTLQTLRKDELEARNQIQEMRVKLLETNRLVKKSTLPGVPKQFWSQITDASGSIQSVAYKLEEKPLDMATIHRLLKEANDNVNGVYNELNRMLENALLSEKLIQYGNRYRNSYPFIAAKLIEAEQSFRSCQYDLSLEQAAEALEEIDENAIENVNEWLKVEEMRFVSKGEE
ncbi:septation ring formation regulator EzrA [Bacillus solimangrovi]|uniref:Septation ring formation regulator EzrA n=1 Tax=Bacillus solimangrovi TaxID=1305675 RepID=A0A1E5LCJ7_9BACI|nr:septation ring formation regulator EzrA [Bacillus solimangrovi]OEH91808.1 hypothetical protein BFG57_03460 [Bacillus solimangrovi]